MYVNRVVLVIIFNSFYDYFKRVPSEFEYWMNSVSLCFYDLYNIYSIYKTKIVKVKSQESEM